MDDDKMTDEALSTLKLLRAGAPSAEAKKLALNAAMVAFDAAQPKAAPPKRSWLNRWTLGAGLGVPLTTAVAALVLFPVATQLTATSNHLTGVPPKKETTVASVDAPVKTDDAKAKAEDLKQKSVAKAADAAAQLDTARAKPKPDPMAAKDAFKAAETKKVDAVRAATDAKLALEPVSVYISRATQKLYVRRNTHKPAPDGGGEVFDTSIEVPVTIRNPERPLGTHIFTAMAKNEAGLRWSVVSIDNGDDARNALDRVTIPQDVLDRIAPTALPRSSIIISDEPLSKETNYRTEFVAVLSDQPQGGFITRKPTTDMIASRDEFGDDGFGSFFQQPGGYRQSGGYYQQPGWGPFSPPQPQLMPRRGRQPYPPQVQQEQWGAW